MVQSADEIKKIVQEHVAEPVIAIGSVQPRHVGFVRIGRLSRACGDDRSGQGQQKAGALSNKGAPFFRGRSPKTKPDDDRR